MLSKLNEFSKVYSKWLEEYLLLKVKEGNSRKFKIWIKSTSLLEDCRFSAFVPNMGYKTVVKKWRIVGGIDKKNMVLERKKCTQRMFWEKLSLKVDQPKQGGFGSSNVDNTARRAFNNYKAFSEITGVDIQLIFNMRTILICLSCLLPIDLEKYEQLCHTTAQIIVDKYPWLPMTATVHKILVHFKNILEQTVRLFWRRGSRI